MPVPVDIFVSSDELIPAPLPGVVVSVADATAGLTVAGQATTDVIGKASFLLPGASLGKGYEVRFFKLGIIFGGLKGIKVVEPAIVPNVFDVAGTPLYLPVATDPRVCRCTGRFLDLSNKPRVGASIRIAAKAESGFQTPKVVDGNLISAEVLHARSDDFGFVSVDLVRGGEFYVTFSGEEDASWNIKVPDRSSVNLIDLIHPQPVSLTWDSTVAPSNRIILSVGEQVIVPASMLFSDFEILSTGLSRWITLNSSAPTIASASMVGDKIVVAGIAPGQATVMASIWDGVYPSRVPSYSLLVPPLTVTVT